MPPLASSSVGEQTSAQRPAPHLPFPPGGDFTRGDGSGGESIYGRKFKDEKDGLKLENRLVALDPPVIVEASVDNGSAEVTVRFEADIAAVTRDAEGNVVAGSMSDAIQSRERWTFRRELRSANPNWLLIETDDEE